MNVFRLGLTGSIGMGKSATAQLFANAGLPVWNADHAVHRLYGPGGAAVEPVAALYPGALDAGGIARDRLRDWIDVDPTALARLEAVVHPLVAADRAAFLAGLAGGIAILDIPLLFETGAETSMDATLLVTAPASVQRARVLARPGMTEARLATLLARQMPDAEKRGRATHILETLSPEVARAYVTALIDHVRANHA